MSGGEEGEIIDPPAEGPVLRFIRLTPRAYAPERMTEGSAGYDLKSPRTGAILPQRKLTVQTELSLEIPKGYVGKIYPRSGLADQYCITTLGGIIDSDFRGNVSIILMNLHKVNTFILQRGMRIAQLLIEPVVQPTLKEITELTVTPRGTGGLGSTGLF